MARHVKPHAVARRLGLLAAGTGLVLIATSVSLARHRKGPPRRHPSGNAATRTPSRAPEILVAEDASPPSALAIRQDRPRVVASLRPIAIAAAVVLGGLGVGFVGVAVESQRSAPEAPKTSLEQEVALGRDVEGRPTRSAPGMVDRPPPDQPTQHPTPVAAALVLPSSHPVSLHIPAIGVRSVVHDLGLAGDGTLETPLPGPRYNDAAWYRHSPTPGSLGPSILLGHVDSAAEGPSVFFRLGELTIGDRIAVTRADDSVAVFRVDLVRRYAKDDFPTDQVYGDIDHAGLRIVTCGGAFDNSSGHYLDNVVVFASLVGSPPQWGDSVRTVTAG